ncbi:MAG: response regulator [Acidobacteria bacterium]|nr:response regulator [Acidobacteriota bacterium]
MNYQNHLILIVDDEPINLMMLQKVLRNQFQVKTANSAVEALDILNHEDVSLMITDQRMPGMSGTELLRKSREICPDMACFLLTAENDVGSFLDAIVNLGAICVIKKPWNPEQLLRTIESSLERYEGSNKNKVAINQLKKASEILGKLSKPK